MTAQIFIALFGVTAVALSQSSFSGRRRWASVFGLLGQPFWFYSAWEAQRGMRGGWRELLRLVHGLRMWLITTGPNRRL